MKLIFSIHLAALLLASLAIAQVRSVTPRGDQIITIKTALGIATIVQAPSAIRSAIIGDQSAYRVEYLDRAITIKPLRSGARTNLYLMTENSRFNLRLQSSPQDSADFVVYLTAISQAPTAQWKKSLNSVSGKTRSLSIQRLGTTREGFFLIEGEIGSKEPASIDPAEFWILQGGDSKVIHHVFIADRRVASARSTRFALALAKADLVEKRELIFEWRGREALKLVLPQVGAWR